MAVLVQFQQQPAIVDSWAAAISQGGPMGEWRDQPSQSADFSLDGTSQTLASISYAGVRYPLRRALPAYFVPGVGSFIVDGLSPAFIGSGATRVVAEDEWARTVHVAFQRLSALRPFEMTDKDKADWSVLESAIDTTLHRNTTPLRQRQYGTVCKHRGFPEEVQWDDGTTDPISLTHVDSPSFATYRYGQPFEAIVERDPLTHALLRIVHVEPREHLVKPLRVDEDALRDQIGSFGRLPTIAGL